MYFSTRSMPGVFNLKKFLSKLKKTLLQCSDFINTVSENIPHWASSCAHFLYVEKGVPPHSDVHEPGKLYLSYKTDEPGAVTLVGATKDKRQIKRKLEVKTKGTSNLVTLTSKHVDFVTGRCFTCTGVGQSFQSALDHYFSTSLSGKDGYPYNTTENVHQEGDAFLLSKVLRTKGNESWINDIVNTIKKLFEIISPERHKDLALGIENSIRNVEQVINAQESQNYDPRLWLIMMCICQHFDPITGEDQGPRQRLREYIIAESCRKLMKEEDIIPGLAEYFEALQMHCEIIAAGNVQEYEKKCLYPEIPGHREQIKAYHEQCSASQNENIPFPPRSEGKG